MIKILDVILSSLTLLLGIIHIGLTGNFYKILNDDAFTFIGMGLAFIFLALLNFTRIYNNTKTILFICTLSNLLGLAYIILPVVILKTYEIQGFVAIFILLGMSIIAIRQIIKLTPAFIKP